MPCWGPTGGLLGLIGGLRGRIGELLGIGGVVGRTGGVVGSTGGLVGSIGGLRCLLCPNFGAEHEIMFFQSTKTSYGIKVPSSLVANDTLVPLPPSAHPSAQG